MTRARHLAPLLLLTTSGLVHADFEACRDHLKQEAEAAGITSTEAMDAIAAVEQRERIIELDRSQPEFVQTFQQYLDARVTPAHVERGRDLFDEHGELLQRVQSDFGVPPAYIVAFWGLETHFGRHFGRVPVMDALATLACDQRRSEFFTAEFLDALRIVDDGNMAADDMQGSWAGAMGHMQFMPSTFNAYAVDYDDSGRIDIWNSLEDAFGSAGSYLEAMGWQAGQRWGREVTLPDGFDFSGASLDTRRSVDAWADMGVRMASGASLPSADMQGSIIVPSGADGPAFLVYDNFRVIMRWNRSISYAISVGYLADRIAGLGQIRADWDEEPLAIEEVEEIQRHLNALGHDSGEPDGMPGPRTRAAIRDFQAAAGRTADGHPDHDLLEALQGAVEDSNAQ